VIPVAKCFGAGNPPWSGLEARNVPWEINKRHQSHLPFCSAPVDDHLAAALEPLNLDGGPASADAPIAIGQTKGVAKSVVVTGASGFIGSHLAAALVTAGYHVRAMTRRPAAYQGAGDAVPGDVADPATLGPALEGVDVAYYLVHSLGCSDFEDAEARSAHHFAAACAQARVERIVYLGGLGADGGRLSAHLRSRRAVEQILGAGATPVTVLRAAVVIGHGSISWEITRQIVDHLPALITPRWVKTLTQPIALPDVVGYLIGVLEPTAARGRIYEIGGPDVLRYIDMLERVAAMRHKPLPNLTVPLLTPRLSSAWLALVTDVDLPTARNLVESMTTEAIVRDHSIEDVVPRSTLGYDDAVRLALAERDRARTQTGTRRQ
jgi:uncharacterized protein YbjT (DUF2867 family)